MNPSRLAPILACLLLASACATSRSFVCPARGGPAWLEVTTDHFVLRTDVPERRARQIAAELEVVRAVLLRAFFDPGLQAPGRVQVVVFRSLDELMPYTRDPRLGGLMFENGFGERWILAADAGGASARRLVAHELAHVLAAHATPRAPRWYAEGLAMFLEGVGESGPAGGRAAGSPPGDDGAFLQVAVRPPTRDVVAWRRGAWPLEHLYAKSLLVVHYLYNERRPGLHDFQARLAAMERPPAAWDAAFPEWPLGDDEAMGRLDAAIAKHAGRHLRRTKVDVPGVTVSPAVRELTPPEVHSLRLDLPHRWIAKVVRAEVDEALAEDPAHVLALQAMAAEQPALALGLARRAVAAHPDDPRAWEFLGQTLEGDAAAEEREAAFREAVQRAPGQVRPLLLLAVEQGARGRLADALATSGRALELAPWSPLALLVNAQSLAGLGRCGEARGAASRAADLTFHGGGQRDFGEALAAVERACAPPGPSGRADGR